MSEVHLRRRIPPLTIEELTDEFLNNTDLSHYDAQQMAVELYASNLAEIYRLARLGEDLDAQVKKLANFIMDNLPGEPSQSEGAIDCAIRILQRYSDDLIKMTDAYIEAANPGIDMDKVRRSREAGHDLP